MIRFTDFGEQSETCLIEFNSRPETDIGIDGGDNWQLKKTNEQLWFWFNASITSY